MRPEADGPTRASWLLCNWAGLGGDGAGKRGRHRGHDGSLCQGRDPPEVPRRAEGPQAPGRPWARGPAAARSPQPAGSIRRGWGGLPRWHSLWPPRPCPRGPQATEHLPREKGPQDPGWTALQGLLGLFGAGRARESKLGCTGSHGQAPGVPYPPPGLPPAQAEINSPLARPQVPQIPGSPRLLLKPQLELGWAWAGIPASGQAGPGATTSAGPAAPPESPAFLPWLHCTHFRAEVTEGSRV